MYSRHLTAILMLALILSITCFSFDTDNGNEETMCEHSMFLVTDSYIVTGNKLVISTYPRDGDETRASETVCICARIDVERVVQAYDNLNQDAVLERLQLQLDAEVLKVHKLSDPYPKWMMIEENTAWPQGATAIYPGVFGVCWGPVRLKPGPHQADILFVTTANIVERYAWKFEILP